MSLLSEVVSNQQVLHAALGPLEDEIASFYARGYGFIAEQFIQLVQQGLVRALSRSQLHQLVSTSGLLARVDSHFTSLAGQADARITQAQRTLVQAAQDKVASLAREQLGELPSPFRQVPPSVIAELVGRSGDGKPLGNLLRGLAPEGVEAARQTLVNSVLEGRNPKDAARDLSQNLGVPLTRARTIARTEVVGSFRASALESMRQNADVVKGWRWTARKSARTCVMCLMMDGRLFPLDEEFGSHPNCTCTAVPVTKTWDEMGHPEIPERRKASELQNGEEWLRAQSTKTQKRVLGLRRYEQWKSGDLQLEELVGYREDPEWGPTRWVRSGKQIREGRGVPPPRTLPPRESAADLLAHAQAAIEAKVKDIDPALMAQKGYIPPGTGPKGRALLRAIDEDKTQVLFTPPGKEIGKLKGYQIVRRDKHNDPIFEDLDEETVTVYLRKGYVELVPVADTGRMRIVRKGSELPPLPPPPKPDLPDIAKPGFIPKGTGPKGRQLLKDIDDPALVIKYNPNTPKPEFRYRVHKGHVSSTYDADTINVYLKKGYVELVPQADGTFILQRRGSSPLPPGPVLPPPPTPAREPKAKRRAQKTEAPPPPSITAGAPETITISGDEDHLLFFDSSSSEYYAYRHGYVYRLKESTFGKISSRVVDRYNAEVPQVNPGNSIILIRANRVPQVDMEVVRARAHEIWSDTALEVEERREKIRQEILYVRERTGREIEQALVETGEPGTHSIGMREYREETSKSGYEAASKMTNQFKGRIRHFSHGPTKRAYALGTDIHMSVVSPSRVYVHEIGHVIERQSDVRQRAKMFMGRRTRGESPKKLSKITGNRNYRDTEVAKPDAFIEPYMGKVYDHGSTEIHSMGMEYIWATPEIMLQKDPDMFDFIYKSLRGIPDIDTDRGW